MIFDPEKHLMLVAVFALLLFLHPYLTYPLSLKLFRSAAVRIDPASQPPPATLVFCAYNEEEILPSKLANVRTLKERLPELEALAYSDCSNDATLDVLAHSSEVRVLASKVRTGKAYGMRLLVERARGDVIICTDANVLLEPSALAPMLRYFADPNVGGVAGTLRYVNSRASDATTVGSTYWRLEETIKRLESRSGSIMGADGSIFAVRKSLYPLVPENLLDDMTVSMTVPLRGFRFIHADDVIAYEKHATNAKDEFNRKRRIACRAYNTHRYLWPIIRATFKPGDLYKYISHKYLRWWGFPLLFVALTSGAVSLVLGERWLFFATLVCVGTMSLALGSLGVRPFTLINQVVSMLFATFLGIIDSIRGKDYQTWTPAASRG